MRRLVLASIAGALSMPLAAAPPAAIVLEPSLDARLPKASLPALCAGLAKPCDPATTTIHRPRGGSGDALYLIDTAGPLLIRLAPDAVADPKRATSWDFSDYRHSSPPESDTGASNEPLTLAPALYPAGAGRVAIALVSNSREMYSGGGASFEVADFLRLDSVEGKAAGTWSTLYAAVPFACSKMVRACFTEREYKTSRHCHDESSGFLTISFAQDGGVWRFTWHDTQWPANVAQSRSRTQRQPFSIAPGKSASGAALLPAAAEFCGGPV